MSNSETARELIDTTGWVEVSVDMDLIATGGVAVCSFHDDFIDWTIANLSDRSTVVYQRRILDDTYKFWFLDKEDALMFKLRWGGR